MDSKSKTKGGWLR